MSEESINKELHAVIDRMILAGWVRQSAHSRGFTSSELTPDGIKAIASFRRFLRGDSSKISAAELSCFLALVESASLEFTEDDLG